MSISPGSRSPAAKVPSAMPRSIPSATCRHNATPEAASCMLMVSKGRGEASEKSSCCHETVMAFIIKLSSIIDNLVPARPMTAMDENGKQAQRKAAMTVLAHSDAAEIAGYLGAIALPAYDNLREPECVVRAEP